MNENEKLAILEKAKKFFSEEIVANHIDKACKSAASLDNYNVNPFLFKYLANFLKGNDSPESIAEALILPRILGASINTSFGMKIQKLISELFEGYGSTTPGLDIEFIDAIDGRKKYCQLKAGPNTINFDDVETIFNHFDSTIKLARTNNLNIGFSDLVVGVIYGEDKDLSSHYQKIDNRYPVIIGKNFWYRLTGDENFYFDLINAFGEVAIEVNGTEKLQETIKHLANDIRVKLPL